ncbi:MAG TPA: bacillithiol biosynthesis deacetylase BshB1 [Candidatus Atribacteria bacterium]|nr:bacillithiol biosynthesis deacetylase BshB1 [Candidatus Atribacteria bacterium]
MLNILAVGPHPDDVELGMGGSILKFTETGHRVTIVDLTDGEPTLRGNPEIRKKESVKASRILGIEERITLDFPNRYLQDEIEARQELAEIIRKTQPDILFAPYWIDAHPDHISASKICEAARFYGKFVKTEMKGKPLYVKKIYYYISSHLRQNIKPSFIMDISKFVEMKIEVIRCYESQFGPSPEDHQMFEWILNSNRYWGNLIGTKFAEPFISKEEIGIKDIEALL